MDRIAKVKDCLAQYEEGTITFIEFVNYVTSLVTNEDQEEYKQQYT